MLYATPDLGQRELEVIAEIADLKKQMKHRLHEPRRWFGSLRRVSKARAIQGSNSIEGYDAALDDVDAVDLGEDPIDADAETALALRGYRDAMTYVLQLANEDEFTYSEQLLKSLHFMMTSYDLKNRPGLWRAGQIFVRREETGEIVYEGAELDEVPGLMAELVAELNCDSGVPPTVKAAMAHLNLVMIHPFRDGNGRMARCLQTLVLAREGILSPSFCSIEEYLGRNTPRYYDVLAQVGQGNWHPANDATPWVRFILTAHVRQVRTILRRIHDSEEIWTQLEDLAKTLGFPERSIPTLFDATLGYRIRNATYRAVAFEYDEVEISDATASRDLHRLVEVGLLRPVGEKRGRYYLATQGLAAIRQLVVAAHDPRDDTDPFATPASVQSQQPSLFGSAHAG